MIKHFLCLNLFLSTVCAATAQTRPTWFKMPNSEEMFGTYRKVYFHYQGTKPLQFDNQPPDRDYYTRELLNPHGENDKWLFCGGFMRQRPLARIVAGLPSTTWEFDNLKTEVERAIAGGADGFDYDFFDTDGDTWNRLKLLLDAAQAVDPKFRIIFKPDMYATAFYYPETLVKAIKEIHRHPSLFRMRDGRMVVSPYNANNVPVEFWNDVRKRLEAQGVRIVYLHTLRGWWSFDPGYYNQTNGSMGLMNWGGRLGANTETLAQNNPTLFFGQTVTPQYFRPNVLKYRETDQSQEFRDHWGDLIKSPALDFVNVVSWSDYGEGSEIAPATETGGALFELNAYYSTWFKTRKQPQILKDTVFLFNRIHRTSVQASSPFQTSPFTKMNTIPVSDKAEALVFLTSSATVRFTVGEGTPGKIVKDFPVPAGMTSVKLPLIPGSISAKIVRNGLEVLAVASTRPVVDKIEFQDFLMRGVVKSAPIGPLL